MEKALPPPEPWERAPRSPSAPVRLGVLSACAREPSETTAGEGLSKVQTRLAHLTFIWEQENVGHVISECYLRFTSTVKQTLWHSGVGDQAVNILMIK